MLTVRPADAARLDETAAIVSRIAGVDGQQHGRGVVSVAVTGDEALVAAVAQLAAAGVAVLELAPAKRNVTKIRRTPEQLGLLGLNMGTASISIGRNPNADIEKGVFDRFRSLPIARSAPLVGAVLADIVRYLMLTLVVLGAGYAIGFRVTTGPVQLLAAIALSVAAGPASAGSASGSG